MLTETDVRAMTDEELLDIWADQSGYVPEAVGLVKSEIKRRDLDTSAVHIRTPEEVDEDSIMGENRTLVRYVTFAQGVIAVLFLIAAVLTFNVLAAFFGVVLLIFAVAVWRNKPWAMLCGWIFYSVAAIGNGVLLVLAALSLPGRNGRGWDWVAPILAPAIGGVVCICFARSFRSLRKYLVARKNVESEPASAVS